jgi:hypothetical protein
MFHLNNKNGLDPAYPPVALNVRVPSYKRRATRYVAFWLKPVSIFGLFARDDVYQQFTCVSHTVQPSAPSALMLADADIPSRFCPGFSAELHCHGSFTHTCYQICMCH